MYVGSSSTNTSRYICAPTYTWPYICIHMYELSAYFLVLSNIQEHALTVFLVSVQ